MSVLFLHVNKSSSRHRSMETINKRILLLKRLISRRKLQRVIIILSLLSRQAVFTSPRSFWTVTRLVRALQRYYLLL